MGIFTISIITKILSWLVAGILIYLNVKMLANEAANIFEAVPLLPKIVVIISGILFPALLIYIIFHPLFSKRKKRVSIEIHPEPNLLKKLTIPVFNRIAVALDFSEHDEKLIAFAIGQGKKNTHYLLIHIVESASARMLGEESYDYETRKDKERLDYYVDQLQVLGFTAEGYLGFQNRAKEIVRIVKASAADMLVVGAHGHTGIKDFIYGETVNSVRHELKIPVLVVSI